MLATVDLEKLLLEWHEGDDTEYEPVDHGPRARVEPLYLIRQYSGLNGAPVLWNFELGRSAQHVSLHRSVSVRILVFPADMNPFWNSCTTVQQKSGVAALSILLLPAPTAAGTTALAKQCRQHYVGRKWLELFGRKGLAEKLQTVLPVSKSQRSGDLGEILATEYVNRKLWGYEAPVLRLRWKDGRDLALRGDDVIGFNLQLKPVGLLKGESKSRATLTGATLENARAALCKNKGLPGAFSLEFIVEQLANAGQKKLARRIQAEACGARLLDKREIAHLLFVLTGNNPVNLLDTHLAGLKPTGIRQLAVAVHCHKHQALIAAVFEEAGNA